MIIRCRLPYGFAARSEIAGMRLQSQSPRITNLLLTSTRIQCSVTCRRSLMPSNDWSASERIGHEHPIRLTLLKLSSY